MIGPHGENLIFVISPPRAGSTLLQRILAGNADVFATAEPWLMLHPLYALRNKGHSADYNSEWAHAALTDFCENFEGGVNVYTRAVGLMARELYNNALRPSGRRCFLDKTPRYYFIAPELLRTFPAAKFIFLLRNPLAVLSSILTSWIQQDWPRLDDYTCDLLEAPLRMAEAIDEFGSRAIVQHYETLVQQPEETISALCAQLGLSFEPSMLEYGQRPKPKGRMGDTVGVDRHQRPVADSCEKWKSALASPREHYFASRYLEFLDETVLARLGYPKAQLIAEWNALRSSSNQPAEEWQSHADKFFPARPTAIPPEPAIVTKRSASDIMQNLRAWCECWTGSPCTFPRGTNDESRLLSNAALGCMEQAEVFAQRGDAQRVRDYIERACDLASNDTELHELLQHIVAKENCRS